MINAFKAGLLKREDSDIVCITCGKRWTPRPSSYGPIAGRNIALAINAATQHAIACKRKKGKSQ
jgi:hypothetical protein